MRQGTSEPTSLPVSLYVGLAGRRQPAYRVPILETQAPRF